MIELSDVAIGQAAGLATSALWTVTSILFTAASKRLGPTAVNAIRLAFAIILLGGTYRILSGQWWPDLITEQVLYLALSGLIGLSIGDQALFTAFVDVGPRIAMLLMTTAPLFAAFFGWIALGETLGVVAWVGVLMTVGGVAWVVFERPKTAIGQHPPNRTRGIVLGIVAAACQAAGLMLSKVGIGHGLLDADQHLSPQAATFIRMTFAGLGMIPMLFLMRHLNVRSKRIKSEQHVTAHGSRTPEPVLQDKQNAIVRRGRTRQAGLLFCMFGTIFGPFLGVWMSLVAADYVSVGIAQTLTSLPPVLLLPVAYFLYNEHISWRAIVGAILAVGGVAMLCFEAELNARILQIIN